RLSDGTRRVVSISEITGMEGDTITMQEIFQFERKGIDKDGHVIGRFRPLELDGATITFNVENNVVTGFTLKQGTSTQVFKKVQ
ncbi:MAG TPA: hypothetical protein VGA87_01975, partial [Pyrinomonadaceae bacterium]